MSHARGSCRQVLRTYGLDALLFLRSLRLQAIIIFIACVYSLGALPIYIIYLYLYITCSWASYSYMPIRLPFHFHCAQSLRPVS